MRNKVTVLGLGNILLRDEGVGVHAANAVRERYTCSPAVEIVDGGTMGLDLLPFFQESDKVLIIDAVDFGKPPGHVGTVEGDAIPSVLSSKLSVHHIGLSDLLFAAKLANETMPAVCLVGMQPKSLDVGLDMSAEVRENFERLIQTAVRKLSDWNISCASRSPQRS